MASLPVLALCVPSVFLPCLLPPLLSPFVYTVSVVEMRARLSRAASRFACVVCVLALWRRDISPALLLRSAHCHTIVGKECTLWLTNMPQKGRDKRGRWNQAESKKVQTQGNVRLRVLGLLRVVLNLRHHLCPTEVTENPTQNSIPVQRHHTQTHSSPPCRQGSGSSDCPPRKRPDTYSPPAGSSCGK